MGAVDRLVDVLAASYWRTIGTAILLIALAVWLAVSVFRLSVGGSIALYFVVWWTVLFAVLPFAARRGAIGATEHGGDPGAPQDPRLRHHAIWATLWSDVTFLVVVAAFPLAGL